MKCPVCGGLGFRNDLLPPEDGQRRRRICGKCHGNGCIYPETTAGTIDTPDIIEGCKGEIKGYKEDKGDA